MEANIELSKWCPAGQMPGDRFTTFPDVPDPRVTAGPTVRVVVRLQVLRLRKSRLLGHGWIERNGQALLQVADDPLGMLRGRFAT